MKSDLWELSKDEKRMKKIYLSGKSKILTTPMYFEQYKQLIEENPDLFDTSKYYEGAIYSGFGVTLDKKGLFADKKDVELSLHGRYAYPILHNHAFFEIVYVYSGSCVNYIENTAIEMKPGDFCFLAPNTMHTVVAVHDEDVIINLILSKASFERFFLDMQREKNLLSDFFKKILYDKAVNPFIIFPTGEDRWIRNNIVEMYRESQKRKYAFEESLVLYARLLFIHIIRDYEMMAIVPGYSNCNMDNNIVAILGYISTNYNIVSLQELAGFFCYNESYLSRLLKYHTGKTFNTIVNELKLEHAREMLENTDKTIGQISQEVGCFDSSHLSKKFNKRYGISPKEYREKSRHK